MNDAGARSDGQDAADTQPRFTLGAYDPDPRPQLVAGRYRVGRLLGEGATARVFRAHDEQCDRSVALKLFHPGMAAAARRRHAHEIRILKRVRHPGIVALYDAGVDGGHAYLAMSWVDGPTLAGRLANEPFTVAEVTGLATKLANALAYVHDHGVTHRDLKPANILLAADGPLISDFGVAHAFDTTRVTAVGAIVGTAAYMAPEQVLGEDVSLPADVYALGLVLLECLTGAREYLGPPVESAVGRLHRPPRIPPGLPGPLAETLRRMTARQPSDRPSAAEVAHALRPGGASPAPIARRRFRARTLMAIGAPVVLLTLLGAAMLTRPEEATPESAVPIPHSSPPAPSSPSSPPQEPPAPVTVTAPATVVVTQHVPVGQPPPGKPKKPKKPKNGAS